MHLGELAIPAPGTVRPDGSATAKVEIDYPLGHRRRRAEGIPLLVKKFEQNLATPLPAAQVRALVALCQDRARLEATAADAFMALWVRP